MQAYEVNVDEDFYEDGVDFGMQAGDQLYTDAENGKSPNPFHSLSRTRVNRVKYTMNYKESHTASHYSSSCRGRLNQVMKPFSLFPFN